MAPKGTNDDRLIRLSALLSKRGVASRREAEQMMTEGRVMVDYRPVREMGTKVDPDQVLVEVDGRPIPDAKAHVYFALHKPPGYLSSFVRGSERGRLLGDLLPSKRKLVVAGRLDRASSGLLLVSSDGDWVNHVMHPRYEKEKEYLIRVGGRRPTPAAKLLAEASFREGGREFKAHKVEPTGSYVRLILHEGRKHQIRRLADSVNLEVRELVRVRVGEIILGELKPGKFRALTFGEQKSFMK